MIYKVIQRDAKTKRQVKKRVYLTDKAFNQHSPDIIDRYTRCYDVEVYNFIDEDWKLFKTYPCKKSD